VLAVASSACGSRLSDPELAGPGRPPASSAPRSGADPDPGPPPEIGTLPVPCGEGSRAPGEPPAGTPGVTADTLSIVVISDRAGQVKVPTASVEESVQAFVDWCNGFGGINGRTLELTTIDSELFSHLEATKEACDSDAFAIVGSGSVADNQGAQQMVDCGLVEVPAYTATPAKALSANVVQPLPNPSDRYNVGPARWVAEQHPAAVERAAILYPGVGTAQIQATRIKEAYAQAGFDFVFDRETSAVQENYVAEVLDMKQAGIEWVTMISAASETVKLLRDMRTQGFAPTVVDLGQQYYGPELLAEPAAEGALVTLSIVPFEEVASSPALGAYLDAYAASAGGGAPIPTALGVNAFSAGLLFATAAAALGDDLTRENLLEQLQTITSWDGGGLHAPANPGERAVPTCFAYLHVVDGAFERLHPAGATEFDCDPDYGIDLSSDFGGGAG
jgi:ABC-type branched-subunit amino acid transport system substrate-binding protein